MLNKTEFLRLLRVTVAVMIYVFGVTMFVLPAHLYTGGLNGYAVMIHDLGANFVPGIPLNLGILVFVINAPAFYLGLKYLSKKFMIYSTYTLILQSFLFGFISFEEPIIQNDILASALFGGLFMGMGIGYSLRQGAALGGLNIFNQILSIKKQYSVGAVSLTLNVGIILLAYLFFDRDVALYTLLGYLVSNIVVDKIHTGYKRVKLEITTEHGEEIRKMLLERFPHGMTVIDGVGGYTERKKQIIFMVAYAHETFDMKQRILEIDPNAYITKEQVHHMSGNFKHVDL